MYEEEKTSQVGWCRENTCKITYTLFAKRHFHFTSQCHTSPSVPTHVLLSHSVFPPSPPSPCTTNNGGRLNEVLLFRFPLPCSRKKSSRLLNCPLSFTPYSIQRRGGRKRRRGGGKEVRKGGKRRKKRR